MAKFTQSIEGLMEIAQGTVAFPSVETLPMPQSSKISGFELPAAGTSEVNFKCAVPSDLDATPNGKIRIFFMTLDANTNDDVDIKVSTHATSSAGVVNVAFTDESTVTINVPDTIFSLVVSDITLTDTPLNGQFITGQIIREGANDTATKILLMKVQLLVDVDVT